MKTMITILIGCIISMTVMGQGAREKQQRFEQIKDHYSIDPLSTRKIYERFPMPLGKAIQADLLRSTHTIRHRLDSSIYYGWSQTTNQWVNSWKQEYSYNANEYMTMYRDYEWDYITKQWISDWKCEFTYDVFKNMTLFILYVWDDTTYQWINGYKEE